MAEQERFFGFTYYSVGIDGLNVLFIPLTAILALLILVYKAITRRTFDWKFIACLLGYEAVLMGAFSALNVIQFWFWSLLELIPVILIDDPWRYRATKTMDDYPAGAVLGLGSADDLGGLSAARLGADELRA